MDEMVARSLLHQMNLVQSQLFPLDFFFINFQTFLQKKSLKKPYLARSFNSFNTYFHHSNNDAYSEMYCSAFVITQQSCSILVTYFFLIDLRLRTYIGNFDI